MIHQSPSISRAIARAGRMALSLALVASLAAPALAQERVDMAAIAKIKDEGFNRLQAMDVPRGGRWGPWRCCGARMRALIL